MAHHDQIDCILGNPCIHFEDVSQRETIPIITIETIHHVLVNLDEELDKAWEDFHPTYEETRKLLRC